MASRKKLSRIKKSKLPESQIKKRKVRASPEWTELRETVKDEQKVDPISMRPLSKSFGLHHLSQDDNYYNDLERNRFVGLNDYSHRCIHYLYDIVQREGDFEVLERIRLIIERMQDLTESDAMRGDTL